jgi:hypothetical protein
MQQKDLTCPRTKSHEDLMAQLRRWQQDGDKLIVCLDANEDIYPKLIGKALTDINRLAMKEIVGKFTHQLVGLAFFRGSKPINGVWSSSEIIISNACSMPAGYSIGDHGLFVIDFRVQDIIGQSPQHILRSTSCHLNSKIPQVAAEYVRILEEKVIKHCLIERMDKADTSSGSREEAARLIDKIDKELENTCIMRRGNAGELSLAGFHFHQRSRPMDKVNPGVPIPTEIPCREEKE